MAVLGFWAPLALIVMSVLAMIAVAAWADARRREREALYRSELFAKLAGQPVETVERLLTYMREEQARKEARGRVESRAALRLGGCVLVVVGASLSAFLFLLVRETPVWSIGLLPGGIGIVLLLFSFSGPPPPVPSRT